MPSLVQSIIVSLIAVTALVATPVLPVYGAG